MSRPRAVGYLRVSTNGQAQNGLGFQAQERAVRTWARANGVWLVGILRDEGVDGGPPPTHDPEDCMQQTAVRAAVPWRGASDRLNKTLAVPDEQRERLLRRNVRLLLVRGWPSEVIEDELRLPDGTVAAVLAET